MHGWAESQGHKGTRVTAALPTMGGVCRDLWVGMQPPWVSEPGTSGLVAALMQAYGMVLLII